MAWALTRPVTDNIPNSILGGGRQCILEHAPRHKYAGDVIIYPVYYNDNINNRFIIYVPYTGQVLLFPNMK